MSHPAPTTPPAPAASAPPSTPLWVELDTSLRDGARLADSVLAHVAFGPGPAPTEDPRYIQVGLPLLGGAGSAEIWHSVRPVTWDRDGGVGFAHDGSVLFGSLYLLECELDEIAAATYRAYARITTFLGRHGFPHLLRCWNFMHEINRGNSDRERYRQFCVGRYQALAATPGFETQLPAGTAIGMREPGLLVYFLAARAPGRQIENPRQVPAFQYPRQYGPRSPSFSRAALQHWGDTAHLMVSGTASVVGHATRHPGDSAAQLEETVENLRALLDHAAATHLAGAAWVPQSLKFYLRHRADAAMARHRLEQLLGRDLPVVYLEGDICRTDLQLEIEGVFAAAHP